MSFVFGYGAFHQSIKPRDPAVGFLCSENKEHNFQDFLPADNFTATMLKAILITSLVAAAAGFQPAVQRRNAFLKMASTVAPRSSPSLDDWSNKPLPQRKSTTPVAVRKVSKQERERIPDVMIDANYFLTWGVALLGPLIWWYHPCK